MEIRRFRESGGPSARSMVESLVLHAIVLALLMLVASVIPGSQRRVPHEKRTSTSSSIVQRRSRSRRPRSRLLRQKGQRGQQRPGLQKLQKGPGETGTPSRSGKGLFRGGDAA